MSTPFGKAHADGGSKSDASGGVKMTKPRCSVIIPTHNCLKFLGGALESVRLQAIDDTEIIVVDDGSTDGSHDWLRDEATRDSRLVILQGERMGPAGARNLAISQAQSELVAFLDADDLWAPRKLERQLAFHEANPGVVFSFTDYLHIDLEGKTYGTCFEFWRPPYFNEHVGDFSIIDEAESQLLACNVVGTSTVMATRAALQNANGFATDLQSAEDWDLWLKLAGKGRVAVSKRITTNYLMRPNSETQHREARIMAMKEIVASYEKRGGFAIRGACKLARARINIAEAECLRISGQHWQAAKSHLEAFLRSPNRRLARAAISDVAHCLHVR
jgi:glycosyltransferase involved in cell wall biosynthesis